MNVVEYLGDAFVRFMYISIPLKYGWEIDRSRFVNVGFDDSWIAVWFVLLAMFLLTQAKDTLFYQKLMDICETKFCRSSNKKRKSLFTIEKTWKACKTHLRRRAINYRNFKALVLKFLCYWHAPPPLQNEFYNGLPSIILGIKSTSSLGVGQRSSRKKWWKRVLKMHILSDLVDVLWPAKKLGQVRGNKKKDIMNYFHYSDFFMTFFLYQKKKFRLMIILMSTLFLHVAKVLLDY